MPAAVPKSNYTAAQLIETIPADTRDIPACADWFSDVYRWADLEQIEDIKAEAWVALKHLASLCARQNAIDILSGKLQAYIKIVPTDEPKAPDLEPDEPDHTDADWSTMGTFSQLTDDISVSGPSLP
jgi:hypothetical protein